MYATIRRYTLAKGGTRRVASKVEAEFVAILRSVPGFVSYALIEGAPEGGRDTLATISVFTTREGAEESVRKAAEWVKANLAEFDPSAPQVTAGELVVSTPSTAAPTYTR